MPRSWARLRIAIPIAIDVGIALALVVAAILTRAGDGRPLTSMEAWVGALWMAGLALRTTAPLAMAVWIGCGLDAYLLVSPSDQMPIWTFVGALWAAFSVGSRLDGRRRLLAAGALLVALAVSWTIATEAEDFADRWLSPVVIVVAPIVAGAVLRRSRRQTAELRALTLALQGEREAHAIGAAAAERNRVAREIHDVISHSVSVMVVQAGAADQLLPPDSPAREQVQAVRATGRQALAELAEQLGILREGPDERPLPVPSLGDLGRLAADAGARCRIGDVGEVPPGTALTAYRVAQEALTNARKHAAGGSVQLSTSRSGADLLVEVVNGPGHRLADTPGSGRGLQGMRERVELYAGRLEAGPTDDRGWRVRAVLPVGSA